MYLYRYKRNNQNRLDFYTYLYIHKGNILTWSEIRTKCKRQSDYIITLFITNEISLVFTWFLTRTKIKPNHITIASLVCGILCGLSYYSGYFKIGSFFLFFSHILDCTDGNLARAKEIFSVFGRWLDSICDKTAEVFIFICISLYFYRTQETNIWICFPILDALLLMLYYYIVDVALSLGISKTKQNITSITFKGVHVKWGLLEPVIYGFVILAPFGLIKIQVVLVLILAVFGLFYQAFKNYSLHKGT